MKLILLFILSMFAAIGVMGQIDCKPIIGKVKSVVATYYKVNKDSSTKMKCDTDIESCVTYDRMGNITEENTHYYESHNYVKEYRKYDKRNKLIDDRISQTSMKEDYGYTYKYDTDGNIVLGKEYYYDSGASLVHSSVEKCVENMRVTFEYNEPSNFLEGVDTEMLDKKGNVVRRICYSGNRLESKTRYVYNNDNHIIEQYGDPVYSGDAEKIWIMEYDKHGNRVAISFNYKNFEKHYITDAYEYDAEGNWVEAKEFYGDKLNLIVKRKIEYYE